MKILVTGAAGFIGSHTAERLLARGHEVVGTYRSPEGARLGLGYAVSYFAALLFAPPLLVTSLSRRWATRARAPARPAE